MLLKDFADFELGRYYWLLGEAAEWKSLGKLASVQAKYDHNIRSVVCGFEFTEMQIWYVGKEKTIAKDYFIWQNKAGNIQVFESYKEPKLKKELAKKEGCPKCGGEINFKRTALLCSKCGVVGGF